ncbi:MAG: hypothetical protein OWU84_07575 [Firmicutes bacterium]|nr:hypothetical protein [Bacillota bacterium]
MQKQKVKKAAGLALGSSMMLMSMVPAASVFAATTATNNRYISSVTTTVSGDTATASSVSQPTGLHIWYQFRVETPSGHWFIARRFGPSDTYTFVPPVTSSGTWMIEAYALTQYQVGHKIWGAAVGSTPQPLAPAISTVAIQGVPTTDISTNDVITLTAVPENSAKSTVTVKGQASWTVTTASGAATTGATVEALASGDQAIFDATTPGDYTVTATIDGYSGTATIDVYGTAAAVQVMPAQSTLVADGVATDTITATVVDSNGNVVSNFNGTAEVTLSNTGLATPSTGTITFTNGVASFTVSGTGTGTGTVTVDVSDLTGSNGIGVSGISYSSPTITLTAPVPTGLMISPTESSMLAAANGSTTVTVNLVDQLGNPIPPAFASGFDVVTLDVVGPGSLQAGTTTSSATVYVAAGLPWTATVYDPTGASGTILVTASASGLTEGIARIAAEPIGLPAQIAVSSTTGTLSTALSATAYGINESKGTQYTAYTITLEDANGTPVPAPSAEVFTVTDNASTGVAYVLSSLTTANMASQITAAASTTAKVTLPTGDTSVTFYVMNTKTQAEPTLLTIATTNDYAMVSPVSAVLSATATAPYTFVTGPAAIVDVTGPGDVLEGQSATYTAQITDINDNPVAETGTVTFDITDNTANDASFANGATSFTTSLNSNGEATVVVYASGTTTGTFVVAASVSGVSTGMLTGTVVSLASLVTNLEVVENTSTGTSPIPSTGLTIDGLGTATFTVYERNGVDVPVPATDNLTVSVSNPSGVILETSGGTFVSGSLTLPVSDFNNPGNSATFSILGGVSGTVTITVSDASNPNVPAVSFPVTVDALQITAAGESGFGNVSGGTGTVYVNGVAYSASYASSVSDFATYNQQAGVLDVLAPTITTGTIYSGTTSSSESVAVWDIGGTYYYLALDESPNVSEGASSTTAYVGIEVTAPAGNVEMAINSGTLDGNSGPTDYAYFPVAVQNSSGTWEVAPSQSFVLDTQVSLPSPGPTIVYPIAVQEP